MHARLSPSSCRVRRSQPFPSLWRWKKGLSCTGILGHVFLVSQTLLVRLAPSSCRSVVACLPLLPGAPIGKTPPNLGILQVKTSRKRSGAVTELQRAIQKLRSCTHRVRQNPTYRLKALVMTAFRWPGSEPMGTLFPAEMTESGHVPTNRARKEPTLLTRKHTQRSNQATDKATNLPIFYSF